MQARGFRILKDQMSVKDRSDSSARLGAAATPLCVDAVTVWSRYRTYVENSRASEPSRRLVALVGIS